MNEETNEYEQSEEDKLLDPIAKSILRDLQAEATSDQVLDQDSATDDKDDEQHANSEHIKAILPDLSTTTTALDDNGQLVIKCDVNTLSSSELGDCKRCETFSASDLEHCKQFLEKDGDDADGSQGGQTWRSPTANPTTSPSSPPTTNPTKGPAASPTTAPSAFPTKGPTASPSLLITDAPSFHPTIHGDPFVLTGTFYYDVNGNGQRDSNIDSVQFGNDVEYNQGLGGVHIQLKECDPETNTGLIVAYQGGEKNSYATAVSQGVDVLMKPRLVSREENGGKYNLINIKINRAYYIYVTAPTGYLLSGGVCNDDEPGWECEKNAASQSATGDNNQNRRRQQRSLVRGLNPATSFPEGQYTDPNAQKPSDKELELGIRQGRSSRCVFVDRSGMPDSRLDIGVMRVGDSLFSDSDVELSLDLISPDIVVRGRRSRERSLQDVIQDEVMVRFGRDLSERPVTRNKDGIALYQLEEDDKEAIGIVTSEVMASNLDYTLLKKGVVLDSVSHVDVLYFAPEPEVEEDANSNSTSADVNNSTDSATDVSEERDAAQKDAPTTTTGTSKGRNGKLAVNLMVRGHFNRDLDVDFDYIVQDSINRDAVSIRRQLTHYNQNCRNQTAKVVDLGFTHDDFLEVHTNTGVKKPLTRVERQRRQGALDADEQAFSSACDNNKVLPDYFEASLGVLKLNAKPESYTIVVNDGGASILAILGGILAVGAFVLCLGYFLFQRRLKQTQQKTDEATVSHIVPASCTLDDDLDKSSIDDMFSKDESESRDFKERRTVNVRATESSFDSGSKQLGIDYSDNSKKSPFQSTDRAQVRGFTKMTASLTSERRRHGGDGGGGLRRKSTAETAQRSVISDLEAGAAKKMNMVATEDDALSKNAVPMIIDFDFENSIDDDSGSSSDGESSSDSSSSSSDDSAESSSQARARQRREKIRMSMKSKGKKKKVDKMDAENDSKTKKRSKVEKRSSMQASKNLQQGPRRSLNLV